MHLRTDVFDEIVADAEEALANEDDQINFVKRENS